MGNIKMATKLSYDEKLTSYILDNYKSQTVAQLALHCAKTEKSMIAKMVSMGIYEKPVKAATVAKTATPDAKNEIISTLAILLGINIDEIASLGKANKNDLLNLQQAIIRCAHFKDNKK